MRGKDSKGQFEPNFNPVNWGRSFTEGDSWHWTWCVFHDPEGLIQLMGGNKNFVHMLDSVFLVSPDIANNKRSMIHEEREMEVMNMGNYAHGNQPIQHMIYLYNYAGEPWKAQYWLREVMDRLYSATPDGYCGDEDNGQTSAWYVFSAMGFYPVCPGSGQYVIGTPYFKKLTLHLENGKQLVFNAPACSDANKYISTLTVDGKPYGKNYFNHTDLMKGGTIDYGMASTPNYQRGTSSDAFPYSFSKEWTTKGSKKSKK